jgi:hypothetical protein
MLKKTVHDSSGKCKREFWHNLCIEICEKGRCFEAELGARPKARTFRFADNSDNAR